MSDDSLRDVSTDSGLEPEVFESMFADPRSSFRGPGATSHVRAEPPETRLLPQEVEQDSADSGAHSGQPAYRLLTRIGAGGMGEVWSAIQSRLERIVAVKRLGPKTHGHGGQKSRFRQEALLAGQLDHPNIVPVHDLGVSENGELLIAMKYVRGKSWHDMIDEDIVALPPEEYISKHVRVMLDVGQAVAFAHSRGIVHRDLKPSQVVIGEFGEVTLMDWGLALCIDNSRVPRGDSREVALNLPSRASAPSPAGTPCYMAPEQIDETAERIGEWTDVYLLGATLYHVLAGWPPREKKRTAELRDEISRGRYTSLDHGSREVSHPQELRALVEQCMHPQPEQRCASAKDFVQALEAWLTGANKRRESMQILEEARACIEDGRRDYNSCTECLALIGKALSAWPGNQEAVHLREEALNAFARAALRLGDLTLARVQIGRIAEGAVRSGLENEAALAEARAARREKTRRIAVVATGVLLLLIAVISAAFNRMLARSSHELARELYRSSLSAASGLIQGDEPQLARQQLLGAPAEFRNVEWGLLYRQASPELRILAPSLGPLRQVSLSEPASTLALVSDTGRCAVMSILDGKTQPVSDGVRAAGYSPDGEQLAVLRLNDSLAVLKDGVEHSLGESVPNATALAWSSSGNAIIVGSHDGYVSRIDALTGAADWRSRLSGGEPLNIAVARPDGRIAVGLSSGEIEILTPDGSLLRTLTGHAGSVLSVAFDGAGHRLLSSSADATVRVWNPDTGAQETLIYATNEVDVRGAINRAVFSPSGRDLVTAGADSRVKMFDSAGGALRRILPGSSSALSDVAADHAHDLLATCGEDGTVRIWDPSANERMQLHGHLGRVVVRGIVDNRQAVTLGHDNTIRLWDLQSASELLCFRAPFDRYGYCDGRITRDGRMIAILTRTNALFLYDLSTGTRVAAVPYPDGDADDAAIDPAGLRAAISGPHGKVLVFDTRTRQTHYLKDTPDSPVMAIEFSPDGQTLGAAFHDGLIGLYDAETGVESVHLTGHAAWAEKVAFSSDGRRVATASWDGTARVWDSATGAGLAVMKGHNSWLSDVCFGPGDTRIITSSADGTVRFWDAANGLEMLSCEGNGGIVESVCMSADGRSLVATFRSKDPEVWEMAPWNDPTGEELRGWQQTRLRQAMAQRMDSSANPLSVRLRWLASRAGTVDLDWIDQTVAMCDSSHAAQLDAIREQCAGNRAHLGESLVSLADTLERTESGTAKADAALSQWRTISGSHLQEPVVPYSASSRDEEIGRPLHLLVIVPKAKGEGQLFIAGNRPELASWTPNTVAFEHVADSPEGSLWMFSIPFRPLEFKLTFGRRGDAWLDTQEWEGPPNRSIDLRTPLHLDGSGTIAWFAVFGEQ